MTAISYERLEIHSLPSSENVPLGFWQDRVKEIGHPELKALFSLPNRDEAARFTAEKILEQQTQKTDSVYSLPSSRQGNDVLSWVVRLAKERDVSFEKAKFFHLDEYFPIRDTDKDSFRRNLRETFFEPLGILPEQIHYIHADPGTDGKEAAAQYEKELATQEVDLVLHPIGPDGHMGFNEAGTSRESITHLTPLSEKTVHRDRMIRKLNSPDQAITQGIQTILGAKKILFINFSPDYKEDMKQALYGPIGEHNPSSFLRTVGDKVEAIMTGDIADHVLQ